MIFPLSATSRSFSSSFSFCSSRSLSLSSKRQLWASLSAFCSSLTSPSRFASSCSILCFSLCWSLQLSILRSSSFLSSSNVPVKGERVCAGREVDGQRTPAGGWKRGPRVSLTNAFPVMLDELLRRRKVVEEGFVCKVESRHLCRLAVLPKGLRGRSSSSWAGCGPPLTPVALGRNQPPPDRVLSPELRIEGVSEGFKKKETTFPTSFPKIVSFFFFSRGEPRILPFSKSVHYFGHSREDEKPSSKERKSAPSCRGRRGRRGRGRGRGRRLPLTALCRGYFSERTRSTFRRGKDERVGLSVSLRGEDSALVPVELYGEDGGGEGECASGRHLA